MSSQITDFNSVSSSIYNKLTKNEITLDQYKDWWNKYAEENPLILENFRGRKDRRTLGDFAVELATNKKYEEDIIQKWIRKCNESDLAQRIYSVSPISCTFNGIEKSGQLVLHHGKKKDFKKADYLILPPNKPLEIKNCPSIKKATFKAADLEYYKKENADILVLMGNVFFLYFTTTQYGRILDYAKENNKIERMREMGFKPCLQLYFDEDCSLNKCAMPIQDFEYIRVDV